MDSGQNPAKQVTVCRQISCIWRLRAAIFFYVCLSIFCVSASQARAIVTDVYPIDLPDASLHRSLIDLGQQTQVSIIFPTEIANRASSAIAGEYSVLQALEEWIEGLDLEYRITGPETVVVLPRCYAARSCKSQDELQFSTQQYSIIEELVIRGRPLTGSRFKQINANAFNPVEIITSSEIRLTGAQTMAELMRFTPEVAGNSTSTAVSNGGNGSASVTLRGLPATNTLVLVNGQRVANNALDGSSVDLNSIPLAAVDRIEILKTSGSSIYGSDAIAGVVNVILKKRFVGAVLNGFYGSASAGDNETSRYDFVGGIKLDAMDLMITASHYQQNGIFSRDRDISASADGRAFGGIDRRSSATTNARLDVGGTRMVLADGDGSSVTDFRPATDEDLFDYQTFSSSLAPAERDAVHLAAEFKDLGSLDGALELTYVDSSSVITLAPTPVLTGFSASPISISPDNIYNPFGQQIDDARIRLLGLGPRLQFNNAKTTRVQGRVMGTIRDGEWQLAINWSKVKAKERWQNLVDISRLAQGLGPDCIDSCVPINFFASAELMPSDQLDFIRAEALSQGHSELLSVNLDLSQLANILPAGEAEFASGFEFRREKLFTQSDQRVLDDQLVGGEFDNARGSRSNVEMYLESLMPLAKDRPGIYALEANASFRLTYSTNFTARVNPKLALRYSPVEDLMFRASLSTGFRAPSLFELHKAPNSRQALLRDPCATLESGASLPGCSGVTDALRAQYAVISGGNEALEPEKSQNVSIGFMYSPSGLENFTLSLDLYSINVDQVIGASAQFFLNQNALTGRYADRVLRNADGELISLIASSDNLGSRQLRGADVDVSWRVFIASWGTLGVNLSGAYIDSHRFKLDSRLESVELAGTFSDEAAEGSGSIPEWKSRLNLFWQFGRWEFSLASMHVASLREQILSQDRARESGAWSREDLQVSYRFNSGQSLVTLGAENIFDQMPPFLGSAFNDNFDVRTHDSTGRFVYARLSHRL